MTKKLYDRNSYETEFEATVESCEVCKEGFCITLDQTLFFPEEGGQSPDQGKLDGVMVLDVQIKKDVIYHTLKEALPVGKKVKGSIDWKHRFSNMQQHTGEHIFSGLVHKCYGFENVGFHLSDQVVTMDFSGVLTERECMDIEQKVNEAITRNIDVFVTFPSKQELNKIEYRSKIEIEGQVRIVTIPGYDVCACCAPHVKKTGEIGILKVIGLQNYKGGVRINILCGFRALDDYIQKQVIVKDLSALYSAKAEEVAEFAEKYQKENGLLKQQLLAAKQEIMKYKISELDENMKDVILFERGLDSSVIRSTVNQLTNKHDGVCAVFSGDEKTGYQYIIGSKTVDVREINKRLRDELQAKGGGSAEMVQGSVKALKEQIEEFIR